MPDNVIEVEHLVKYFGGRCCPGSKTRMPERLHRHGVDGSGNTVDSEEPFA